jgi:hypothetical protein
VNFNFYASPGNVENETLSEPKTLAEWQEKTKEAKEELGGFVFCKRAPDPADLSKEPELLVNIENVRSVLVVEGGV